MRWLYRATRHFPLLLWLGSGIALFPAAASAHLHDVIRDLAATPGGTVFAISRFEALRSTDGGLNFERLRISRSIDGADFADQDKYTSWFNLSPNYDEDNTLFGLQNTHRSTDGGLSWQPVAADFSPCKDEGSLIFSPHFARDNTVLILGSKNKSFDLYRSTDKGISFNLVRLPEGLKFSTCPRLMASNDMLYLATRDGEVLASGDTGASWRMAFRGKELKVEKLVADVLQNHLLLATKKQVFRLALRQDTQWPLGSEALTEMTLPAHGKGLDVGAVASHIGPENERSLFVMRTSCPTKRRCEHTGDDVMFVSHDAGTSWDQQKVIDWWCEDRGNAHASHFRDQEFTHIVGIPGTRKLYMGTWNGIYVSEDGGGSWTERDTIARTITGLTVAQGSSEDGVYLEVCTYSDGCFGDEINLTELRQKASRHTIDSLTNSELGRYGIVERSPSFGEDRLALRSTFIYLAKPFVHRSVDGFETFEAIEMETLPGVSDKLNALGKDSLKSRVNTIRFSPGLAEDGIVYAGGSYMGLAMSTDRGKSFTRVWDAEGGSITSLSLSPDFASDGTLIALVDFRPEKRPSTGVRTKIYLSKDRGLSWKGQHRERMPWYSAILAAGPDSKEGTTIVALTREGRLYINSDKKGVFNPLKNVDYSDRPLGIGQGGLIMGPNGELAAAYYEGSVIIGRVSKAQQSLTNVRDSRSGNGDGKSASGHWMFSGDPELVTKKAKAFNDLLIFSPNYSKDFTLFGASYYSIYASFDGGVEWKKIYDVPFREPRQCDGDFSS